MPPIYPVPSKAIPPSRYANLSVPMVPTHRSADFEQHALQSRDASVALIEGEQTSVALDC